MNKKFLITAMLFFFAVTLSAQVKDYRLGSTRIGQYNNQSGYFDLSDPESLNIIVSLWGFVKYPGRYLVPFNTTATDLISYGGGPQDNAYLDRVQLFRTKEDSTQQIINLGMRDILHGDTLSTGFVAIHTLEAGDVLLVPGEPRLYFQQKFSLWMSFISILISLSILIINITRK